MSRQNHRPERTCMGCNGRDAKVAMVRVVSLGATLVLDEGGRHPGRGGYLHRADDCLRRFVRSKRREFRSLGRKLGLDERSQIAELIRGAAG